MYEMVIDPMNFVNYYYKLIKLKTLKYYQYQKIYGLLIRALSQLKIFECDFVFGVSFQCDIISVFMGQNPSNQLIHLRKI